MTAVASGQLDFTVGTEGEKIRGEKLGLKVIIDMAKLNIPFQFTCTVTTGRMIRENPDLVQRMVRAMAEAVHFYKNNKDPVVKIMQKYSRGPTRTFFEEVYDANLGCWSMTLIRPWRV